MAGFRVDLLAEIFALVLNRSLLALLVISHKPKTPIDQRIEVLVVTLSRVQEMRDLFFQWLLLIDLIEDLVDFHR